MNTMTDKFIPATADFFVRASSADRGFAAGNFVVASQNTNKDSQSQDDNRIPTEQTPLDVPAA